ncbi:MAG: class I SAM-dependent methyltransferase [Planctomycetota bacterium]
MTAPAKAFQQRARRSAPTPGSLRARVDRARYRAQQISILVPTFLGQRLFSRVFFREGGARPESAAKSALERRYNDLLERDFRNVEQGFYPRDLLFQFPLGEYARLLPRAVLDVPRVIRRKWRRAHDDLPASVDLDRYPRYFRRTFHWQTDGYLSEHSARMYDASVEFLFGGTADVMRRMAIPPLVRSVGQAAAPRILDIACGTGRFLKQLHAALPGARLYGLDLSPYYLKQAARLLVNVSDLSLVAENAEELPFADDTFDAQSSVFLFHELPRHARRAVLREAYRTLKPGGVLVVVDSSQLSESRDVEVFLHSFAAEYHEPYYEDYLRDDLGALFEEVGFAVEDIQRAFLSKVVVGRKKP